jgi:arginyl-tRNA synthetase
VQKLSSDILATQDAALAYGEHTEGRGKTAIVDFPSFNMAKPVSVGHLRPSNQGWAIYKLLSAMGYDVVRDNHIGDWGTPFGKWAVGFSLFSSEDDLQRKGIHELARIYIKMTAELKYESEHGKTELADQVQEAFLKLEQGDPEMVALSKRFKDISMEHIHAVMQRLQITTDEELGESFYIPQAKQLVAEWTANGTAVKQEDGSVIADIAEYGIDTPVLLEKRNGTALYMTSDVACIAYRLERWHPAKIIYPVGQEQKFHFAQLFALADKLGYHGVELVHSSFGMIDQLNEDGTRGKMSSRKGVILLEDLLDKGEARARAQVADNGTKDVSDEDISRIALGAIKFTDFAADRNTNILFDWNRIFALQGFSGPYVQYAGVRIRSILRKFEAVEAIDALPFDGAYDWQAEKDILLHLVQYPVILREAAATYEPHRIAQFTYDLARLLNRYYEDVSITDSEPVLQKQRLWLLARVATIHEHALALLGIEIPQKM